jgi:hypothetical protein
LVQEVQLSGKPQLEMSHDVHSSFRCGLEGRQAYGSEHVRLFLDKARVRSTETLHLSAGSDAEEWFAFFANIRRFTLLSNRRIPGWIVPITQNEET